MDFLYICIRVRYLQRDQTLGFSVHQGTLLTEGSDFRIFCTSGILTEGSDLWIFCTSGYVTYKGIRL